MMNFSLKNANGSAVTRLKAWGIYDVTFNGIEAKTGKSKEGNEWKAIQLKFSGEQGVFEPMIFCPMDDKGAERPTGETGGRTWTLPSRLETFMYNIAHIGEKLGTKATWEKMQGITYNIPDDFDKIVKNLQQVTKAAEGKPTHIKIVGDSKGYAKMPDIVGLTKEGEVRVTGNWIGDNLAFDDYEIKRMNNQKNAKPSQVDETTSKEVDTNTEDASLNYDL